MRTLQRARHKKIVSCLTGAAHEFANERERIQQPNMPRHFVFGLRNKCAVVMEEEKIVFCCSDGCDQSVLKEAEIE